MSDPLELLRAAYGDMSSLLLDLTETEASRPTGCQGWAVLDLAQHLAFDARRGLVALSTPTDAPADTDAVRYWGAWQQTSAEAADDRWRTRVVASAAGGLGAVAAGYAETAAAVLVSASRLEPAARVRTQGHVMTVADLLSTLVTETAVHHLDLVVELDRPGPAAATLAAVRDVLTGLLGRPLPDGWDDVTAVLRSTGRGSLSDEDRRQLGSEVRRFPLLA